MDVNHRCTEGRESGCVINNDGELVGRVVLYKGGTSDWMMKRDVFPPPLPSLPLRRRQCHLRQRT